MNDGVDEGVIERQVPAWTYHFVIRGLGRCDRNPRVEVGDLGTLFHGRNEAVHGLDFNGLEDIAAIENHMPGIPPVGVDLAVGVSDGRTARRVYGALADRVMCEVVRRADGLLKGLGDVGYQVGTLAVDRAFGPELIKDIFASISRVIQSLFPTHPFPLAGTALTGAYQGGLHPLGVVQAGYGCCGLGAYAAVHGRHVWVAPDADHLLIFHLHLDRAAHGTHKTERINNLFHQLFPPVYPSVQKMIVVIFPAQHQCRVRHYC